MSDIDYLTAAQVIEWFTDSEYEDEIGEILCDLPYESVGAVVELPNVTDFQITVAFLNTDRNHDSYGYSYLEDGYIILAVTDRSGSTKNFKLPMSYASFEGWDWNVREITEATYSQKIVTTWEWI